MIPEKMTLQRGHALASQLPAIAALHQSNIRQGILKEDFGKGMAAKAALGSMAKALTEITASVGEGVQDSFKVQVAPTQ